MRNITFRHFLLLLVVPLGLYNCNKTKTVQVYPNADEVLWPYFQAFEEEGKKRQLSIDLVAANVFGAIQELPSQEYVGYCGYQHNQVVIGADFWNRSSHYSRELIVFHELGHCYLNRQHDNRKSNDGRCQSIMRNGNGTCVDFYTGKTRKQLLDELFLE